MQCQFFACEVLNLSFEDRMDDSRLSVVSSSGPSGYKPLNDTRSSVPKLPDDRSIQLLSNSDFEDQLTDHNENEALQDVGSQPEVVSLLDRLRPPQLSDLVRNKKSSRILLWV